MHTGEALLYICSRASLHVLMPGLNRESFAPPEHLNLKSLCSQPKLPLAS